MKGSTATGSYISAYHVVLDMGLSCTYARGSTPFADNMSPVSIRGETGGWSFISAEAGLGSYKYTL